MSPLARASPSEGSVDSNDRERDLDTRFAQPVAPSSSGWEQIAHSLREQGAPETCHVLGGPLDLDGTVTTLDEAPASVVGSSVGTILCCIPGELAYYESEEQNRRYILKR